MTLLEYEQIHSRIVFNLHFKIKSEKAIFKVNYE